jgi:nitronate monooxygenase
MIETPLTKLFDLKYPVLSAPMAGHSGGRLAAAVSQAGGLGLFGAASNDAAWLREQIGIVRDATDRPFGVGFLAQLLPNQEDRFAIALEAKVPVITLSFADPTPWIKRTQDAGIKTICQVQSLETAKEADSAGADVIVVQGTEAGGHTGTGGLLPLLESVLDALPARVIVAAGGIASGRSLAAVLAAGADGVWMGTRFLATPEATEVSETHKRLIVESNADDTVFTQVTDMLAGSLWPEGIGARLLRNQFTERWNGREAELRQHIEEQRAERDRATGADRLKFAPLYMGTGAGAVREVQPVAEVMETICSEAEALLARHA